MPGRRRSPRLLGLIAAPLAGAAIAWIVAWACALWGPLRPGAFSSTWIAHSPAPSASAFAPALPDEARLFRLDRVPRAWREHDGFMGFAPRANLIRYAGAGICQTDAEFVLYDGPRPTGRRIVIVDCGWPWACLSAEWIQGGRESLAPPRHGAPEFAGVVAMHEWQAAIIPPDWLRPGPLRWSSGPLAQRVLPYRPRATGMIGNAAVWGLLAALPFIVWHWARRTLRRRRGLCAGCGYDIRDLATCPECGAQPNVCSR